MRKWGALAIGGVLLISLATPVNAAAPKAGATCTKKNATATSAGKLYTCILSGKKLVWNKGVAMAKPKPTPTETPTPTPSPSTDKSNTSEDLNGKSCATENQVIKNSSGEFWCLKSASGLSWAKNNPDPNATPSSTGAGNEVPVGKWQETQFAIVKALTSLKPAEIQKLNFIYSPGTNKTAADKLQASYQEPITLLSNLFVNPRTVTFLVMNESEHDWWWSQVKNLNSNMEENWWGGSHCKPDPASHCGYGTSPNPDGTFHFGQLLGSQFVWKQYDYTIAYHESIHVYQLGLMGTRMNALPTWFAEGQANYLGYAFSHKYWSSSTQRKDQLGDLKRRFPELANFNTSEWSDWLMKIDSNYEFTFNNSLGYTVGELILEALYNANDYQKVHQWMVAIKNGDSYKDGFKTTFGQDYDEWIKTVAAPYLDSQI